MTRQRALLSSILAVLLLSGCDQSSEEVPSPISNNGTVPSDDMLSQTIPTNPLMEYLPYSPATSDLAISGWASASLTGQGW